MRRGAILVGLLVAGLLGYVLLDDPFADAPVSETASPVGRVGDPRDPTTARGAEAVLVGAMPATGTAPATAGGSTSSTVTAPVPVAVPGERHASFDVRLPGAQRPKRATLRFAATEEGVFFGEPVEWTPGSQAVELGPDDRYVIGVFDGYASHPLAIRPGAAFILFLHSDRGAALAGRVGIPQGFQLNGVRVYAARFEGATPPKPTPRFNGNDVEHSEYHARLGGYVFEKLKPGSYWVFVAHGMPLRIYDARVVEIADRQARCDLQVERSDIGRVLAVRAFDPKGVRVPRGQMYVSAKNDGRTVLVESAVFEDELVVLARSFPAAPGDPFALAVRAGALGTASVAVERGRTAPIEVRFAPQVRVVMRLAGLPEALRLRCRLTLHAPEDSSSRFGGPQSSAINDLGVAEVDVQPGAYEARLVFDEHMNRRPFSDRLARMLCTIERFPLTVTETGLDVALSLPALHDVTIRITVPGPVTLYRVTPGGMWYVHQLGYEANWREKDPPAEPRELVFRHLPAGRYEVEYRTRTERHRTTLVVPDELEIDLPR